MCDDWRGGGCIYRRMKAALILLWIEEFEKTSDYRCGE